MNRARIACLGCNVRRAVPLPKSTLGTLPPRRVTGNNTNMSFDDRLRQAIERGHRRGVDSAAEARAKQLTEEEFRRLHSQHRLALSDYIEDCVRRLPNFFPGFQYETVFGDRGWGGACFRDDFQAGTSRSSAYSRLEIAVRPYSSSHVLDLAAKGTIRNREVFTRNFFEKLEDVDIDKFRQLVDAWVLEYVEQYAAKA